MIPPPLGYSATAQYEQQTFELAPGDTVLMMSDGLPERLNAADEELGYPRTEALFAEVAEESPDTIVQRLVQGGGYSIGSIPSPRLALNPALIHNTLKYLLRALEFEKTLGAQFFRYEPEIGDNVNVPIEPAVFKGIRTWTTTANPQHWIRSCCNSTFPTHFLSKRSWPTILPSRRMCSLLFLIR
jgi:hypothetical protein